MRPYNNRLIDIASEIVERDQPNSCSKGTIKTLGADRTAAVTISVRKVIAAMIQA